MNNMTVCLILKEELNRELTEDEALKLETFLGA